MAYKRRENDEKNHQWANAYSYLSATISVVWGVAWFIVSDQNDPFSLAVVGMFIMGISATPFSSYIISMKSLLMFFVPITLLGMINFLYIGGEYGYSFSFAIFIYSVVLLRSAFPVNKNIRESIISKYRLQDEITERKKVEDKLLELSIVDSLTGLYNRRYFDEKIYAELHSAQRTALSTSLILIDIDSFKAYNDNYGHVEGDTCLYEVSQTIKNSLNREEDLTFRYGGEEIAVVLPNTKLQDASRLAENIRKNVEHLAIEHLHSDVQEISVVTVSIGVSCLVPDKDSVFTTLVKDADVALYQAKKNGKNQVIPSATKSSSCAH